MIRFKSHWQFTTILFIVKQVLRFLFLNSCLSLIILTEESQRLLGVADQDQGSEDEQPVPFLTPPEQPSLPTAPPQSSTFIPTPVYNDSTPATLNSTSATVPDESVFPSTDLGSLPPPPDYSLHAPMMPPKYTPQAGSEALPVNVHLDGRLVPATLMQDVSAFVFCFVVKGSRDNSYY